MPLNPAAAMYAGAWIAGQLGGIALGTAIAKKVLPQKSSSYVPRQGYFEAWTELDRLGMNNLKH